jgi:hypothetical protein
MPNRTPRALLSLVATGTLLLGGTAGPAHALDLEPEPTPAESSVILSQSLFPIAPGTLTCTQPVIVAPTLGQWFATANPVLTPAAGKEPRYILFSADNPAMRNAVQDQKVIGTGNKSMWFPGKPGRFFQFCIRNPNGSGTTVLVSGSIVGR